MTAKDLPVTLILGLGAVGAVGLYVWRKGGIAPAAAAVGETVVNTAGSAAAGAVGAVGKVAGLPTPFETTQDPAVARWIIDNVGWMAASEWAGAVALGRAAFMPEGSGKPPPPDSAAGKGLAYFVEAAKWQDYTDDENDRLLARFPRPIDAIPPPRVIFGRRPGEI